MNWLFVCLLRHTPQDLSDKTSAVEQGEALMDGYEQKVTALNDEIENLKREVGVQEQELEALRADDSKAELAARLDELTASMEEAIAEKQEEVERLREEVSSRDDSIEELEKRLKSDFEVRSLALFSLFAIFFAPV